MQLNEINNKKNCDEKKNNSTKVKLRLSSGGSSESYAAHGMADRQDNEVSALELEL